MTWIGRVILRLGLVNLPQFLNIVRGEMALFGPPPVRGVLLENISDTPRGLHNSPSSLRDFDALALIRWRLTFTCG